MFHVYDGGDWEKCQTIEEAMEACVEVLKYARRDARLEGEWPLWVDEISVHEGPEDEEDPSELPCVLRSRQTDINRPSSPLDEDGYDDAGIHWSDPDAFTCDYEIAAAEPRSAARPMS